MDFGATFRLLSDLRDKYPHMRYDFVNGELVIRMHVEDNVPELFRQAFELFEPVAE